MMSEDRNSSALKIPAGPRFTGSVLTDFLDRARKRRLKFKTSELHTEEEDKSFRGFFYEEEETTELFDGGERTERCGDSFSVDSIKPLIPCALLGL